MTKAIAESAEFLAAPNGVVGAPMVLGTNTFGWTNTLEEAFAVLDAFTNSGGTAIDTADSYSHHAPGNVGGESETMIGEWIASRGRERVAIATKVFAKPSHPGLSPENVRAAVDESLRRLKTDTIDLYYAHYDDPEVPLDETAAVFSELLDLGKIRSIGLSNYEPERIHQWMEIVERDQLHAPLALQPLYNLVARDYESTRRPLAERYGLAVFPYSSLASGFLTGKYRGDARVDSVRNNSASRFLNAQGIRVLEVLDQLAAARDVAVASVALAWLRAQPTVVAPIASARTTAQLETLMAGASLTLSDHEIGALTAAIG